MRASVPPADGCGNAPPPARPDGQPDQRIEHIICCRADGIGAGHRHRLGRNNFQFGIDGHPDLHVMDIHVRRDVAAKTGGKGICLVVGYFRLDIIQPVFAHKAVAADSPVMHLFAGRRRAETGWMIIAVGCSCISHVLCSKV